MSGGSAHIRRARRWLRGSSCSRRSSGSSRRRARCRVDRRGCAACSGSTARRASSRRARARRRIGWCPTAAAASGSRVRGRRFGTPCSGGRILARISGRLCRRRSCIWRLPLIQLSQLRRRGRRIEHVVWRAGLRQHGAPHHRPTQPQPEREAKTRHADTPRQPRGTSSTGQPHAGQHKRPHRPARVSRFRSAAHAWHSDAELDMLRAMSPRSCPRFERRPSAGRT